MQQSPQPQNPQPRSVVATPNYSYEKRQRELAKKRKQEEKRQKKATRVDDPPSGTPPAEPQDTTASGTPSGRETGNG